MNNTGRIKKAEILARPGDMSKEDPYMCPTCQSPEPRLHPAVSDGGEVTGICPDPFHGKIPVPPEAFSALRKSKQELQAAVRGDDTWRHPDVYDEDEVNEQLDEIHGVAPTMKPEYVAAHKFLAEVFGEDGYNADAVGQLVEVFIPCLRIIIEHDWDELWRKGGLLSVMDDVYKKFERYWLRTWNQGKRHDDSGFDLINFTGFSLRADPHSRWGERGEPARAEVQDD
jgi:hypothetical protein